jgi:hypothetical protein
MSSTDWVEWVTSLNQWRRGGERAPHKPLLLLYALGRLQRTGSSRMAFAEAEGDLRRLLEEFGPPRSTSPGYPFHHLTTDGLWVVGTPAGTGSPGGPRTLATSSPTNWRRCGATSSRAVGSGPTHPRGRKVVPRVVIVAANVSGRGADRDDPGIPPTPQLVRIPARGSRS